jgi:hypothetical protein
VGPSAGAVAPLGAMMASDATKRFALFVHAAFCHILQSSPAYRELGSPNLLEEI